MNPSMSRSAQPERQQLKFRSARSRLANNASEQGPIALLRVASVPFGKTPAGDLALMVLTTASQAGFHAEGRALNVAPEVSPFAGGERSLRAACRRPDGARFTLLLRTQGRAEEAR
jgi:hypothetical protein